MEYENHEGTMVNHALDGTETLADQPIETPAPAAPEAPQTTAAPEQGVDEPGAEQQGDESPAGEGQDVTPQAAYDLGERLSKIPVSQDNSPAALDENAELILEDLEGADAAGISHLVESGAKVSFQGEEFSVPMAMQMMEAQGLSIDSSGMVHKQGFSSPVGRLDPKVNSDTGKITSARFIKF